MTSLPDRAADDLFSVPWAIAGTALAERTGTVDLRGARRSPAPHAHCAACQGQRIEAVTALDGTRFQQCLDCHRLWRLQHDKVRLVTNAELLQGSAE